ncbi:MAG: universal stress protein [Anaerolineales bacterium]
MSDQTHNPVMTILLADDGSKHAQAAVKLLCDLPLPSNTDILAISVFTPLQASDHETIRESLHKTKECLLERGLHVNSQLVLGYPSEKIIEIAQDSHPELIVMGAKGLRETLGILLGGVVQQVVEYADWPVLVVRAPYQPINNVLFATDGSEYSQHALDYLLKFPLPEQVTLHVLHVLPPAPNPWQVMNTWPPAPEIIQPPPPLDSDEIQKMLAEQEKRGRALIEKTCTSLRTSRKKVIEALKRGDAATEIIDYIRSNQIQLVVLGSRGLSQVKSWLLGSVSRKIIHYSDCTVLVVKM